MLSLSLSKETQTLQCNLYKTYLLCFSVFIFLYERLLAVAFFFSISRRSENHGKTNDDFYHDEKTRVGAGPPRHLGELEAGDLTLRPGFFRCFVSAPHSIRSPVVQCSAVSSRCEISRSERWLQGAG